MASIFDAHNPVISINGYGLSFIELAGTILNIASVWLVARNNIWTWPVGNIAVILFAMLFYQIRLYSDFIEQIYFLITGFYGWWAWLSRSQAGASVKRQGRAITNNSLRNSLMYATAIAAGTIMLGHCMGNIHIYLPGVFPEPASYPYLDAFTTVMSFAATILMAHKKVECWYLWILVDIIGIGLYLKKEIVFVSFLYLIFLFLAVKGLINWKILARENA